MTSDSTLQFLPTMCNFDFFAQVQELNCYKVITVITLSWGIISYILYKCYIISRRLRRRLP